jgi:hypothetical protein
MVKGLIDEKFKDVKSLYTKVPEGFYDNVKHHMELELTGEAVAVDSKIATLTTLYQTLTQTGDPRANQVLERIMHLTGENLEATLGTLQQPQQINPGQPQQQTMNALANINAPQEQPTI